MAGFERPATLKGKPAIIDTAHLSLSMGNEEERKKGNNNKDRRKKT